ncbi:MAG: M28 family metallopeptidase [Salinivirgaceae bacterium]|nr:M28 family metallopeptidase [Salinivirgaceae bacterium]
MKGNLAARERLMALLFFFLASCLAVCAGCGNNSTPTSAKVLARVEVKSTLQDVKLPVYAELEDADENYYVLVIATMDELERAGVSFRVIDQYLPGTDYLLAESESEADYAEAAKAVKVLYNDGRWIIVRYTHYADEILADIGFDLKFMREKPIDIPTMETTNGKGLYKTGGLGAKATSLSKSSTVQDMMAKITIKDVRTYISGLSGESPVEVSDQSYTLTTRDTESGEPVKMATQYIYEELRDMNGMRASFHQWDKEDYKGRNVVGELSGTGNPEDVIILIAHLDSISDDAAGAAPGADDNASGCAALLSIAKAMSGKSFNRTIRFVFTTGEEQGTLGSQAYVESLKGENIVAVLNLDMIAYNTQDPVPTQRVKVRNVKNVYGNKDDMVIATLYKNVVDTYGLNECLNVIITPDGDVNGDQSSFWDEDIAAIWVIEDDYGNFNESNMHSAKDTLKTLNISYCLAQVQATLGTTAHLAGLVVESSESLLWQDRKHVHWGLLDILHRSFTMRYSEEYSHFA